MSVELVQPATPGQEGDTVLVNRSGQPAMIPLSGIIYTGPPGPQGMQGDTGPMGPAGPSGKTSYEIAVENGYSGTQEEWFESLSNASQYASQAKAYRDSASDWADEAKDHSDNSRLYYLKSMDKATEADSSSSNSEEYAGLSKHYSEVAQNYSEVNAQNVKWFKSREDLVSSLNIDWPVSSVVAVGNLQWKYDGVSTAIADMPGWVPCGDAYPNHFADNRIPGTTDMHDAILRCHKYVAGEYGRDGGGAIYFKSEIYAISSPLTLPKDGNVYWVGSGYAKNPNSGSVDPLRASPEIRYIGPATDYQIIWNGNEYVTEYSDLAKTFGVTGLIINGNGNCRFAIQSNNSDSIILDSCRFIGCKGVLNSEFNGAFSGATLPGGVRATRCNFGVSGEVGFILDAHTQDWFYGNWFSKGGTSDPAGFFKISRSNKIEIIANEFNSGASTEYIFQLNDNAELSQSCNDIIINSNKIVATGSSCIIVDDNRTYSSSRRLSFVGNTIAGGAKINSYDWCNSDTNNASYTQSAYGSINAARYISGELVPNDNEVTATLTATGQYTASGGLGVGLVKITSATIPALGTFRVIVTGSEFLDNTRAVAQIRSSPTGGLLVIGQIRSLSGSIEMWITNTTNLELSGPVYINYITFNGT